MDNGKREKLVSIGINVEEALERFSDVEELYERFLAKYINDSEFNTLEEALLNNDFETAFTACHTMKGVVGNLSIIPLYKLVFEETELLRNGTDVAGAVKFFPTVKEEYIRVTDVLKTIYS